jgi:hypothetical protein
MNGVYKIKLNGDLVTYNKFSDIPAQFGAVISFKPDHPEPPHTDEEHALIHTFQDKLQELLQRESKDLI